METGPLIRGQCISLDLGIFGAWFQLLLGGVRLRIAATITLPVLCKLATLIMVIIVGHTNDKEPTLQSSGIILWVHIIYQLTLYNIAGSRNQQNLSQILFYFFTKK